MENRLDIQHSAKEGCSRRHPSAPLQVVQVIHGKPMAQVQLILFQPLNHLVDGFSLFLFLYRVVDIQPLSQGGAEGIHYLDPVIRIFRLKLLSRYLSGIAGAGQAGRKGDIEDIPAMLQHFLEIIRIAVHRYLAGGRTLPLPDNAVKFLGGNLSFVGIIEIAFPFQLNSSGITPTPNSSTILGERSQAESVIII